MQACDYFERVLRGQSCRCPHARCIAGAISRLRHDDARATNAMRAVIFMILLLKTRFSSAAARDVPRRLQPFSFAGAAHAASLKLALHLFSLMLAKATASGAGQAKFDRRILSLRGFIAD